MKTILSIFSLILLTFFINSGISYAQDKTYTMSDTNITVTVSNGDGFSISLDANHTTGYSWSAAVSDPTILMIEGSDYITPETHVMGKGGREVWRFRGVMQGSVTVRFDYSRPFNKDALSAQTAIFNVTVK